MDYCSAVLGAAQGAGQGGGGGWFRSCSPLADRAAKQAASRWWLEGVLPSANVAGAAGAAGASGGVPLLRGAEACSPGLWRAVSCLLHAQPCSPRTGTLPLCLQVTLLPVV